MYHSYQDLQVWQKSISLVENVYLLMKQMPREELYSLTDQIKRAVVSIPSNIAEGHGRSSEKDFLRFIAIAQGSNFELQTQLIICTRLKFLTLEQINDAMNLSKGIGKMLFALRKNFN